MNSYGSHFGLVGAMLAAGMAAQYRRANESASKDAEAAPKQIAEPTEDFPEPESRQVRRARERRAAKSRA